MTIFIHIGLHKTASTFLQNQIFTRLDSNKILYNPKELSEPIFHIFSRGQTDQDYIKKTQALIHNLLQHEKRDILISEEALSQLPFSQDYEQHAEILKQLFPEAKIIMYLRFQPDWILSCYKQTIHQGFGQEIDDFIIFSDTESAKHKVKYYNDPQSKIFVTQIKFDSLLKSYIDRFKPENVNIFFFEDFRKNQQENINQLANILNTNIDLKDLNTKKAANKGASALSCKISSNLFNLLALFKLQKLMINSNEFRKKKGLLPKYPPLPKISWEEARATKNFMQLIPFFINRIYRLRYLDWGSFLQNYFDKIVYKDWDLLEKNDLRTRLEQYFREQNKKLLQYIPEEKIPKIYLHKSEKTSGNETH